MPPTIHSPTDSGPLKGAALRAFVWLSLGNAVRAIAKIAVLAALARLLTPTDFGLVAAAGVVVWFSMIFSGLGVAPALVQRREIEPRHIATGLTASIGLGILAGVAVFLAAPLIAGMFRMEGLAPVLRGMAVAFPIAGLAVVGEALLQRELRFAAIAGAELGGYLVGYGAIGLTLAVVGAGVWSLVAAEIAKTIFKAGFFLRATRHSVRLRLDRTSLRELLGFGAGYTAHSLSVYFSAQGDSLVIARTLGAQLLGLYGRAYELMMVPTQVLGAVLEKILLPTMASVQDDPKRLGQGYRRGTALVAFMVMPVAAGTMVLAPELVAALLGPGWSGAVAPLRILALGMYFRVSFMVGQAVAAAAGAVGRTAWRSALYAALVVLGALVGQRWGIAGVAAGVVLAITVNFALVYHLALRVTRLRWTELLPAHGHAFALALLVGLLCAVSVAGLRPVVSPLAVILVAGAAALLFTMLLVRWLPARLLGDDALWLVDTISGSAPPPLGPFLRRMLRPQPGAPPA